MNEKLKWFATGFACCLILVLIVAAAVDESKPEPPDVQGYYGSGRFQGWKHGGTGMAILDTQTGDIRFVGFAEARQGTIRFQGPAPRDLRKQK